MRIFILGVILSCSACGYGVRGAVGPSWTPGEGFGSTAQVTGLAPVLNLAGFHVAASLGLWGRLAPDVNRVGLSIGVDYGIASARMFSEADDPSPRRSWNSRLSGDLRLGTAGWEPTVGLAVLRGRGRSGERHRFIWSSSEKGGTASSVWYDRIYASFGATLQIGTRAIDGAPEPRRTLDLLGTAEWIELR